MRCFDRSSTHTDTHTVCSASECFNIIMLSIRRRDHRKCAMLYGYGIWNVLAWRIDLFCCKIFIFLSLSSSHRRRIIFFLFAYGILDFMDFSDKNYEYFAFNSIYGRPFVYYYIEISVKKHVFFLLIFELLFTFGIWHFFLRREGRGGEGRGADDSVLLCSDRLSKSRRRTCRMQHRRQNIKSININHSWSNRLSSDM